MSNHEGFLRDIIADPDDDAVRLIYADWLEDNGDPERAEFIRLQCRLVKMKENSPERDEAQDRCDDLLAQHGDRWKAELPPWARVCGFERGFVRAVNTCIKDWNAHAGDLLRAAPVTDLGLFPDGGENDVAAVEPTQQWAPLRLLAVWQTTSEPAALANFFRNPHLRTLRSLLLDFDQRHHRQPTPGMGEALAAAVDLPALEELKASSVLLGSAGLTRLFATKPGGRLRGLGLGFTGFDDSCAELLARWEGMAGLTYLELGTNDIGPAGLHALIRSPTWGRLESLSLGNNRWVGDEGVRVLASAPGLENLRRLFLDRCSFTAAGFRELVRALRPGRLQSLEVSENPLGDEGVRQLAAAPLRSHLTTLDLSRCGFTARGLGTLVGATADMPLRSLTLGGKEEMTPAAIHRLATSTHLGGLRTFWLQDASCGPEGMRALASASWFGHLRSLELWKCDLGDEGAAALADAPLSRRCHLRLYDPSIGELGRQRLRDRFGPNFRIGPESPDS